MSNGKPDPVRVLQVIDTLGMGGAETWLMEVLRRWAQTGEGQMDFLLTSGNKGVFDDEAQKLGARLHYVKFGRRSIVEFIRQFRKVLSAGHYDAIHDHQDYSSGWHFLFGLGLHPRIRVVHVHNPSYQIRNNYGVTSARRMTTVFAKRLVSNFATHIAGTSRQVISEYGFDQLPIPKAALHCAFDVNRFRDGHALARRTLRNEFGWTPESKVVLFAGRIDQSPDVGHPQNHKNSGFAIDVLIKACKEKDNLNAVICGKPSPATPALQQRIQEAGLASRILLLGVRTDIDRFMLASDVLLFPSRGEGLGMVAVEAQAAGMSVLASTMVPKECCIVPELVTFKSLDDSIESWVDTLLKLVEIQYSPSASNDAVANSAFEIRRCSQDLVKLYRDGVLGV